MTVINEGIETPPFLLIKQDIVSIIQRCNIFTKTFTNRFFFINTSTSLLFHCIA